MLGKKRRQVKDELEPEVRHLVNKRLTLNTLIQGAATHAFTSAHHLVKNEMDELDPRLVPLYDKMIASANLGYWKGALVLLVGRPMKFWRSMNQPNNVFYFHRFMRRHGLELAKLSRESALQRCRDKNISTSGFKNEFAMYKLFNEAFPIESPQHYELIELGKRVCSDVFSIPTEKLVGSITLSPAWGNVRRPKTWRGRAMLMAMVGWGGVDRVNGELKVIAKAFNWPLLLHELVKGTMELICLHGLNDLPTEQFDVVMDYTEHLEYEVPMIQIGPEVYRRFLSVLPREIPLAECVMHVSRMDPIDLEEFMFDMIESPNRATEMLRSAARA